MREPRPDWSPLVVNFKILDEHPHLFSIQVHTPPPPREILQTDFFFRYQRMFQQPVQKWRNLFRPGQQFSLCLPSRICRKNLSNRLCHQNVVYYTMCIIKSLAFAQNRHSLIGCESHATCETPTFFCVQGPSITANKSSQTLSLRKRWVQQTAFTV